MHHEPSTDCIFCAAAAQNDGLENLIVFRGSTCFVILNRFPYTSGHLMIVPFAHEADPEALGADCRRELMDLIIHSKSVLQSVYHPEGFNIGANLGGAAGAGVADHLHFHIVPRWAGDSNFMSTLANTRVLPESLEDTFQRLKDAW